MVRVGVRVGKAQVESTRNALDRFVCEWAALEESFLQCAGIHDPDVSDLEGEVEQCPFGLDQAERGSHVDSMEELVGPHRSEYGVDLSEDAASERCPIPAADVEFVVGPPKGSDVALDDLAFVRLRVDDPHARRGDEDVIDIAARSGDQSVVQRNPGVTDLTGDVARPGAPALASLAPAPFGIARGHLTRNLRRVVAVLAPHLVDLALGAASTLSCGRCARVTRIRCATRGAG